MEPLDQRLTIFVVDDNSVIASSLAMILRIQGDFDVASFTDPLEALRASRLACPQLLITDMYMPHLSGLELASQITSECPSCRVALLSGDGLIPDLINPAGSHPFEVMVKPVHPAKLLAWIKETSKEIGETRPQLTAHQA